MRKSNRTDLRRPAHRAPWLVGAILLVLAGVASGCAGAVPHRLAAPPIAGTLQVDVAREGGWETLPRTAWVLESDCNLRVRSARDGEIVRVRYAPEPAVRCTPSLSPRLRVALTP